MEILRYHADSLSSTVKTRRRVTPVMSLRQLQRLVLKLDNKVASDFRVLVEGIFTRYIAGDLTKLELEIQERNLAIHERKLALEERKSRMGVELQEKNLQVVQTFSGLMTALNPEWKTDARLCMQIEDSMKTAMFSPQQPQRRIP